ncbi:Uncharacterised protein [Mycobacterium tuberculosis]|uniref:Uncharacterized protein n=1 Tax=Mycobacterium tuberculosis TaxID=1773 RepID=A0A654U6T6_MYCTX|nr:Uncharacterised protein [Mycobacterium tuberculosis]CNW25414.1 Uncharacterised protein [Mycobacterium tuberculosis]CPA55383.1 Uncharacterised protein [Mycobacterium tuberculosis]
MRATGDGSIRPLTGPALALICPSLRTAQVTLIPCATAVEISVPCIKKAPSPAMHMTCSSGRARATPMAPAMPHPMGEKSTVAKNLPGRRTGIPRNVQEMQVPTSAHIVALGASSRSSSCISSSG